ncbi:hypothetical protein AMTRI_Chr03g53550 [Amborella trichopoda]
MAIYNAGAPFLSLSSSLVSHSSSIADGFPINPQIVAAKPIIRALQRWDGKNRGRWVQLGFRERRERRGFVAASSADSAPSSSQWWSTLMPSKASESPSLSDIVWPAAGAFSAMAIMGKLDEMMASKAISLTIAPFGAVCAVLFATPTSPAARKYNIFMAQIGCAALGVLAFVLFGPGWLARSTALAASIAFMIYTGSTHPPAASLPIMFIDGAKFHHLHFWYSIFPGATGCLLLCLIQEVVIYLKANYKF